MKLTVSGIKFRESLLILLFILGGAAYPQAEVAPGEGVMEMDVPAADAPNGLAEPEDGLAAQDAAPAPGDEIGEPPAEVGPGLDELGVTAEMPEQNGPAEYPAAALGIIFQFKDASLDAVVNWLADAAGLTVIRETTLSGRVTLLNTQPLGVEDAVALLNSVLHEKGYAAFKTGRTLKVVSLSDAKTRGIPVRYGNDPLAIEPTDEVITQVIPLRFTDAIKMRQDLAPLLSTSANLTSNAAGNSLILTDTSANVRRIVEIIHALDSHLANVADVRVFQLKYADATSTAKLITDIFRPAGQQSSGAAGQQARFLAMRGGPGGRPDGGAAASTDEQAQRAPNITASPDARTNTIVVTGPPDTLRLVESIIAQIDSNPVEEQSIFIYPFRNGKVSDAAPELNSLFGTSQTGRTTGGGRGGQTASTGLSQFANGLYGQVYVVADTGTNSLMVMTAPKNFERVTAILELIDRAVPQVLIKVLVAEVTHNNTLDLGAEFSVLNLRAGGMAGQEYFTDFGLAGLTAPAATATTPLALPPAAGPNGLVAKVIESDFTATLRALQTVGKLDVLSRPYILASDNQAATINVGSQFPFVTDSRTTDTGQTINTIQYRPIGITLTVTPHINTEGLVVMDVNPVITAVTDSNVTISPGVLAPIIQNRSATTRVAIRDGQTIVIGGLMQDQKTDSISKVPLLGDVPLLGFFFRRTTTTKQKTELLIFLTPQVAASPEKLLEMSATEQQRSKLVNDAVEEGALEEYIKEMRGEEKK